MSDSSKESWSVQTKSFCPNKSFCPKLTPAMRLLREAWDCAADSGREPRDFAIAVRGLREAGLQDHEMQWLVVKEYAEHLFLPCHSLVLTLAGRQLYEEHLQAAGAESANEQAASISPSPPGNGLAAPHWDTTSRTLFVGDQMVAQLRQRAPNQERIIVAFEEDGWPPHLDDPLPPKDGVSSKPRLNKAIYKLNQRLAQPPVIVFSGDGTGTGVCWEHCEHGSCSH